MKVDHPHNGFSEMRQALEKLELRTLLMGSDIAITAIYQVFDFCWKASKIPFKSSQAFLENMFLLRPILDVLNVLESKMLRKKLFFSGQSWIV